MPTAAHAGDQGQPVHLGETIALNSSKVPRDKGETSYDLHQTRMERKA